MTTPKDQDAQPVTPPDALTMQKERDDLKRQLNSALADLYRAQEQITDLTIRLEKKGTIPQATPEPEPLTNHQD